MYFERALLSEDDEGKSWWYFKIEGDGFLREFEFLLDQAWNLQEMRYLDNDSIKSYIPSVDELSNLSNGVIQYDDYKRGQENIETSVGSFKADHIQSETFEHWINNGVTGKFLKSLILLDGEIVLTASLTEEKENYNTVFNSY